MSTNVSFIGFIHGYDIKCLIHTDDQINKNYSYDTYEGTDLKVIPHIFHKNVTVLRALFSEIVESGLVKTDNERVLVWYSDLQNEGYFVAKLLKKEQVNEKDSTTLSINDAHVVKIKKIASGVKTVIEFRPATHKD